MTEKTEPVSQISAERIDLSILEIPLNDNAGHLKTASVMRAEAAEIARAHPSSSIEGVKVTDVAKICDGVEQNAFEAWASNEGFDMHEHPIHYLFLDEKTSSARQGWKAGLDHARQRILASLDLSPKPLEKTEEQE